MKSFFRNLFSRRPAAAPTVPAGKRVYAIGDIHGELELAITLVENVAADNAMRQPAETHLVFLGDLIDRGASSSAVVEWLSAFPPNFATCHFLRGNHEDALISVLDGNEADMVGWLRHGGRETLLSYGISEHIIAVGGPHFRSALRENMPTSHIRFLHSLADKVQFGDYLFVHAGIRPGIAIAAQSPKDLTWIRNEFLDSEADHGAIIVHGHSIARDVEQRSNRIGIDTGAYATGKLTAIGLEGDQRWFLQTSAADKGTP